MTVHGIMGKPPRTIERHETLQAAARLMVREQVGSLVITRAGTPIGMLTKGDLVRSLARDLPVTETPVEAVMGTPLVTIDGVSSLANAVATMERHKVRHLAVVVGGELRGVVTVTDLARAVPAAERAAVDAIKFRWQN